MPCADAFECSGIAGSHGCAQHLVNDTLESGYCALAECESDADCGANVKGCTATPTCQPGVFMDANMNPVTGCVLDCDDGKTCPIGMECYELMGGARCY